MKLLVTGGAGFIGSHFIRSRMQQHPQDEVVNVDCLTYAGSRERLLDVERNAAYRFAQGDICDGPFILEALRGCEVLVHFAAETHVDRSITDAAPFLRTNIEGTVTLLQAARAQGVRRVIHMSTDEVYGPVLDGAVDEQAHLSPRSPYAASKASADLLVQSFQETYGLPAIIVRPSNMFGPAQLPEKFIPLCVTNAIDNAPLPIYGDGAQRRQWLFVEDFCEALALLIDRGVVGRIYNVGGASEQANLATAKQILAALGRPESLATSVDDRPGHDRRYAIHDAKIRALGWQPATSFEEGLVKTIAWYRAHEAWWRPLVQRLREDPYHWLNRSPRPSASCASTA